MVQNIGLTSYVLFVFGTGQSDDKLREGIGKAEEAVSLVFIRQFVGLL